MKIFTTFALVFIIAVISLVGFAYSGLYNDAGLSLAKVPQGNAGFLDVSSHNNRPGQPTFELGDLR